MDINIDPVTPSAALSILENHIRVVRESGQRMPFFLHGQPGVGKSAIVAQLAAKHGMALQVQLLTQIDATDLRGLQFIDDERKVTVNYPPSWLPAPDDPPTLIFLDELPSAEPRLQVAAYQLLLEGKIGEYVLGPQHIVGAAGNRIDDGAVVYEMGTALADRLLHILVVPQVRAWLEWAGENRVHSSVMTYLQTHGHMLENLDAQLASGSLLGPSPRSWHRVSCIMHSLAGNRTAAEPLVQGWIGKEASADFFLTVEELSGLPSAEELLSMSPEAFVKIIPNNITNLWGMAFSLLSFADTPELMDKVIGHMQLVVDHGPKTEPLADIRTMVMELLLDKADKMGHINTLIEESEALAHYMDSAKEMTEISLGV